jgi:hypothetical protein
MRFLSHIELMNIFHRALRRSGLPLSFTKGFHPHPRLSMGPALAVGMEGTREFFDFELTAPAEIPPDLFSRLLPVGVGIIRVAGPFSRKAGKLPSNMQLRYLIDFGPLRRICASRNLREEQLSGNQIMWYHLGRYGGMFEGRADARSFCADPAGWVERAWADMFEAGTVITDRRGRERSCGGYAVARGSGEDTLELGIPAGAEGFAGPRDLLESVLPRGAAVVVGIRRIDIRYRTIDGYADPLNLITEEI